jgi:hypothetical protein
MVRVLAGPSEWTFTFTCKGCKARLEAGIGDVEWAMFGAAHWAGDSGDKKFYVPCPVCGTDAIIPRDKVTPLVEKEARAYKAGS